MIHVRDLTKRYADGQGAPMTVLDGVDLELAAGDFVALMGPSGSGKSSLLHVLGGLDAAFTGEVSVAGHALAKLSDRDRARLRGTTIGFVFQSYHLIASLPAWRNVALPAAFAPTPTPKVEARARDALTRVGLGQHAHRLPTALSGGERQRVAIARALFFSPPLLLCDEPTGNLDAAAGAEVLALFSELNQRDGVTLLVATHAEAVAQRAKRVVQVQAGKLRERAP